MKRGRMVAGVVACLWVAGCAGPSRNTVYQTSTIDALLAGVYDGDLTLRQLRARGDFGIGTYDNLDGEMVLLDGEFHQVKADGKVYSPDLDGETPFAAVCAFRPEKIFAVPSGADMRAVEELIDREAPNQNLFHAIRIEGQFKTMRTRSVPAQKRPFPPLKEVAATQPVFDMENVSGTVLGFRCPPFAAGVNVPGYHLHFISRDRARGGHVLAFELVTGTAQVDVLDRFVMQLPATEDFAAVDLSRDRQPDLQGVEKDKPKR
ncbi:MAG: acetolactate decarboxylase [Opitutae bacterium]|nr:acetolactate decarboxylase [Opitutae bacterium]